MITDNTQQAVSLKIREINNRAGYHYYHYIYLKPKFKISANTGCLKSLRLSFPFLWVYEQSCHSSNNLLYIFLFYILMDEVNECVENIKISFLQKCKTESEIFKSCKKDRHFAINVRF